MPHFWICSFVLHTLVHTLANETEHPHDSKNWQGRYQQDCICNPTTGRCSGSQCTQALLSPYGLLSVFWFINVFPIPPNTWWFLDYFLFHINSCQTSGNCPGYSYSCQPCATGWKPNKWIQNLRHSQWSTQLLRIWHSAGKFSKTSKSVKLGILLRSQLVKFCITVDVEVNTW